VFADISRAGDLGYTTGPWEFRNNKSDVQPAAYGHYVSIWKKQPDGSWRVRIDVGISHAKPELKATEVGSPARVRTPSRARVKDERMAVLRAERALSNISSRKGMAAALQAYAADDVRLYRPDNVPFIGKTAAQAALEKSVDDVTWQPTLIEVAQSGDLAYCYGTAMSKMRGAKHAMSTSSYMRIWKKQPSGRWNVVLDISNPIPPESKP
jgi:ketosteroid isomerase-like protein